MPDKHGLEAVEFDHDRDCPICTRNNQDGFITRPRQAAALLSNHKGLARVLAIMFLEQELGFSIYMTKPSKEWEDV